MKTINKNSILTMLVVSLTFVVLSITAFAAGPATINLGSAGDFVILAKSGISTTGSTSITGDIGVSPITATAITGFGLIMDSSNTFSTSSLVTGDIYASDYTIPTPAKMSTAISDMEAAYTDAAGRTIPIATELGAGNIGGMTLAPGLYKWSTGVTIPTDVTLSGGANDVWVFQVAQNLTISSAMEVVLSGGAQASNVFWQVAGQTTLGKNSIFSGNILDQAAIILNTGATLNGRALAQTAVTLDANTILLSLAPSSPSPSASDPAPTPIDGSCSSTHYSCDTGINENNLNGSTAWTWACVGLNTGTDASCSEAKLLPPTPIDGSCSSTHYSCDIGTSVSKVIGPIVWTWACEGLDAGITDSCSEARPLPSTPDPTPTPTPTPVDGLCSSTHYSCDIGTSVNKSIGYTAWTWACEGLDAGITDSCSEARPLPSTEAIALTTAPAMTLTTAPAMAMTTAVTAPSLPDTGISSNEKSITWNIAILAGIFGALSLIFKKVWN
ncbi:MAG: ice-binding family protein [Candidatus Peregrinibacteria bacterium]|nr:ice-binding family protein [Candidatus Peregrinibacteria bacterium]MDZ4244739.1 ice-binding family protein [Candidatus Gracilibacteria bacterium]